MLFFYSFTMWIPCLQGANPPLSAVEKQWLYRARHNADPERRQKYLEKECEKYRKDLESGRKKLIGDLSQREKDRRRIKRRENYHRIKDRKEALQHLVSHPHSPELSPEQAVHPQPSTSRSTLWNGSCAKDSVLEGLQLMKIDMITLHYEFSHQVIEVDLTM